MPARRSRGAGGKFGFIEMIYLFYGNDTWRSAKKIQELIRAFLTKYPESCTIYRLDFSDESPSSTLERLDTILAASSLFHRKLLVIVRNAGVFAPAAKKCVALLDSSLALSQETFLLLHEEDLKPDHAFVNAKEKFTKTQHFARFTGSTLRRFLQGLFRHVHAEITPEALDLFVERVGNDLWRAEQEIEKLSLAVSNREITQADVAAMVAENVRLDESSKFALADVAAGRDPKKSAGEFIRRWNEGMSEHDMLSILQWRFRDLRKVAALTQNKKPSPHGENLGLHPFVYKKLSGAIRHWSPSELIEHAQELFYAEYGMKQGLLDMGAALVLFLGPRRTSRSRTARALFQKAREA